MADTGRKRAAEILTDDEVRAILAQCSRTAPTGIRDRALITLMYRTGLRLEETLALKPSDINRGGHTVAVLHGKGDRQRTVGIGDGALATLDLWLAARRQHVPGRPRYLFCTLAGSPLSQQHMRQMLKRRAAHAGVDKRVHPHMLRHTWAFSQVQSGTPVTTIQQQLGHSTLAVTDTYLKHLAPADLIALGRADTWTDD